MPEQIIGVAMGTPEAFPPGPGILGSSQNTTNAAIASTQKTRDLATTDDVRPTSHCQPSSHDKRGGKGIGEDVYLLARVSPLDSTEKMRRQATAMRRKRKGIHLHHTLDTCGEAFKFGLL